MALPQGRQPSAGDNFDDFPFGEQDASPAAALIYQIDDAALPDDVPFRWQRPVPLDFLADMKNSPRIDSGDRLRLFIAKPKTGISEDQDGGRESHEIGTTIIRV